MNIFKKNNKANASDRASSASATGALRRRCADAYAGRPDWASPEDGIRTINFARTVCAEAARLTMLGTKITISECGAPRSAESGSRQALTARTPRSSQASASADTYADLVASWGERASSSQAAGTAAATRADYLRGVLDGVVPGLRKTVELACAHGAVILKPNGRSVDIFTPDRFTVTDVEGGRVTGAVFRDVRRTADGTVCVRHESHRPDGGGRYIITNVVTKGSAAGGTQIPLEKSPWAGDGIGERVTIEGVSGPLFAVLTMPSANCLDHGSPLGLPLFADALAELCDLDVAYSRFAGEIYESRRTVLLDSDRLLPTGLPVRGGAARMRAAADSMGLPEYVRMVYGNGTGDLYHEITPSLRTTERIAGINALLHLIGCKCGFSGGYFLRDGQRGVLTATQVEADDRRTIELVRDIRDQLEVCIRDLVRAVDIFADLYGTAPRGDFELACDFGDITYSRDEDRRRWYGYVEAGHMRFCDYLVMFEGMTRLEAERLARGALANRDDVR